MGVMIMSNNALEIKDVTKKYKDFTLNNISFQSQKAQLWGLSVKTEQGRLPA